MNEMNIELSNAMDLQTSLTDRRVEVEKRLQELAIIADVPPGMMDPAETFRYAMLNISGKIVRIEGLPFRDYELGIIINFKVQDLNLRVKQGRAAGIENITPVFYS